MKKKIIYILSIVAFLGLVGGISYYFAVSGGGERDINGKIRSTDQSGFAQPVLENSRAAVPNGGLRPKGGAATPAPPTPTPEPAPATTTEAVASTTEGAGTTTEATQ